MVEHSIPAHEVVLIFITIYLYIYYYFFIENCPKLHVSNLRTDIDFLLLAKVAFLQCNIGHQNLFLKNYKNF